MATIYNEYMKSQMVSKNEYIALELTKMWSGQSGLPAPASLVLEKYKSFRDELNKEGDNDTSK